MAIVGPTDAAVLRNAKAPRGWGETGYTAYERTTIRPSLSINGIVGGYQREGAKAVIPSHAVAKLNFRLVPDQNPQEIDELFHRSHYEDHVAYGSRLTVRTLCPAHPALINRNDPFMHVAATAYRKGFDADPVFLRSGGTIPVVNLLQETLVAPVVLMGFALPDDQMHAPNERFYLPNFFRGIDTSIWFLHLTGARQTLSQSLPESHLSQRASMAIA